MAVLDLHVYGPEHHKIQNSLLGDFVVGRGTLLLERGALLLERGALLLEQGAFFVGAFLMQECRQCSF